MLTLDSTLNRGFGTYLRYVMSGRWDPEQHFFVQAAGLVLQSCGSNEVENFIHIYCRSLIETLRLLL
ncbi:unnamed protein product [Lathyrus oleraceus]